MKRSSIISENNPIGLDGIDFVEYTGPQSHFFENLFQRMAFKKVASQHGRNIHLYRQGDINFIINGEPSTFASAFSKGHGPSICSVGFRVEDAKYAFEEAIRRGARVYKGADQEKGATPFQAIYGIGDSLIYFMDEKNRKDLYEKILPVGPQDLFPKGVGFTLVDHFTNNVPRGEMQKWCSFYESIFNFREIRYFDIRGEKTGLLSRAMKSPCGKFSVPINEPTEQKSQIQEYLDEYKGSGIQHLALLTDDILGSLETLKSSEIQFLTPPPHTYYEMLKERDFHVVEDLKQLENNAILVDGDEHGYLLQIFTKNLIGPIFYEVIQRKNHFGFGEGNFKALFDSIERDQKERGYLNS